MIDLRSLTDIEEIRRLKARYFRTLDTKDWDGYAAVFTDDARIDVSDDASRAAAHGLGPEPARAGFIDDLIGGHRIADFVKSGLDSARTVHHGHTSEIDVTGPDEAQGVWAMEDTVELDGSMLRGQGHYHERYRRVDGEWRIASLRLSRLRVEYFRPDGEGGWRPVPAKSQGGSP